MKVVKYDISAYVIARDKAIIKCWETESIEPLDNFIEKTKSVQTRGVVEGWRKTSYKVKWLTLCKMTLMVTNKEIRKYHDKANEVMILIRESGQAPVM